MDDSEFAFGRSCAQIDDDSTQGVGFSGYSDFHTIDWQRDLARDRMRHRHIIKKRGNSLWELVKVSWMFWTEKSQVRVYKKKSYDVAAIFLQLFNEHFYHSFCWSINSFFVGSSRRSFGLAVRTAGGLSGRKSRWCHRYWCELDDWPQIWHMSASLLAESRTMLLVVERDDIR